MKKRILSEKSGKELFTENSFNVSGRETTAQTDLSVKYLETSQ
ncbi:hypothetical protein [Pseudarcicella hirudinis]